MSTFIPFNNQLGMGDAPPGWTPLAQSQLLILVGVTGVGKTTTVNALRGAGLSFDLLPNRRTLTDWVLIPEAQRAHGEPVMPVNDRTQRFELTRRYRDLHAGGMAHALSQLAINATHANHSDWLMFDGLRGENEVSAAAELLPDARFLYLHAPDYVRVQRLLGRDDAFDLISAPGADSPHLDPALSAGLLSTGQVEALMSQIAQGHFTLNDLQAKLAIVRTERMNYDPGATLEMLQHVTPERTLFLDTVAYSPDELAQQVVSTVG